jgi:hypothetical protein
MTATKREYRMPKLYGIGINLDPEVEMRSKLEGKPIYRFTK